jgi:hypothetical protein
MFFQILGAIAEFEHAPMSERTRGLGVTRPTIYPAPQQDDPIASPQRA